MLSDEKRREVLHRTEARERRALVIARLTETSIQLRPSAVSMKAAPGEPPSFRGRLFFVFHRVLHTPLRPGPLVFRGDGPAAPRQVLVHGLRELGRRAVAADVRGAALL